MNCCRASSRSSIHPENRYYPGRPVSGCMPSLMGQQPGPLLPLLCLALLLPLERSLQHRRYPLPQSHLPYPEALPL